MGNLLTTILNTAGALKVFEDGLSVTQNNVTNANTPGFVKQTQSFQALPFDLTIGLPGGVSAGPLLSSRDAFAEQSVRDQQTALGQFDQKVSDLTPLESFFDLSSAAGVAPAMDGLFTSFSQLSVNPNDTVSRQAVLDKAGEVAQQFQATAAGLSSEGTNIDRQSRSSIDNINHLAAQIAEVNSHNRVDPSGNINAGLDAQLNSALEQLSQLVNFTALQQPDGTISIFVGGQTPLVTNGQVYAIQGDFSSPLTAIRSSTGADISAQITGGRLSALLQDKNTVLPSYLADLNTLAASFADQVNTTLSNGVDQSGAAPISDLFAYDPTLGSAVTLSVNSLTPDQIAAALPGAANGNGNALNLAHLAVERNLNGNTFAQFYGNLGGRVGNDLSAARDSLTTKQNLLNQAQALREKVSGVSLDEEAAHLIAFQRSYQATAKLLTVLNSLTETLMNIMR